MVNEELFGITTNVDQERVQRKLHYHTPHGQVRTDIEAEIN